jgi:hypothetical protein
MTFSWVHGDTASWVGYSSMAPWHTPLKWAGRLALSPCKAAVACEVLCLGLNDFLVAQGEIEQRVPWACVARAATGWRGLARARSNQQDLIGEMKANRQQKTARGLAAFPETDVRGGGPVNGQCYEGCRERRKERSANCAPRRSEGAFATSAILLPMLGMIATALGASSVKWCVAMSCGAGPGLAAVRVMRAAAHNHVDDQRRAAKDAG